MRFITLYIEGLLCTASAFWRLPCYSSLGVFRIDPIISPGQPSQHAHTLHGAQDINFWSTYDSVILSACTSCAVKQDMSVYWTPSLMFSYQNGTVEAVPQVNGMLIYYFLFGENITAFPKEFRMVAGNASRRNSTLQIPDPPQSLWGPEDKTQDALAQKALGFNCLNYKEQAEGALERHFLPNKSMIDLQCANGLRLELMFPSCWDGTSTDSHNHQSHLAYPDLVMEGNCPSGFESRIPALYYETTWDTSVFKDFDGEFLLSNGDRTGFSYHGDFLNGWDLDVLQEAIISCRSLSGLLEECPAFIIQPTSNATHCELITPPELLEDDCIGPRMGLCGNISM